MLNSQQQSLHIPSSNDFSFKNLGSVFEGLSQPEVHPLAFHKVWVLSSTLIQKGILSCGWVEDQTERLVLWAPRMLAVHASGITCQRSFKSCCFIREERGKFFQMHTDEKSVTQFFVLKVLWKLNAL